METTCAYCNENASVYCSCIEPYTLICDKHLSFHVNQRSHSGHNPRKLSRDPLSASEEEVAKRCLTIANNSYHISIYAGMDADVPEDHINRGNSSRNVGDLSKSYFLVMSYLDELIKNGFSIITEQAGLRIRKDNFSERIVLEKLNEMGLNELITAEQLVKRAKDLRSHLEYNESIKHFKEAYDVQREILGENDLRNADTLFELGWTYGQYSKLNDALSTFKKSAKIRKAILGEAHPLVAISKCAVARAYLVLGKIGKSEQICNKYDSLQPVDNSLAKACILHIRSWARNHMGDPENALRFAELSLKLSLIHI